MIEGHLYDAFLLEHPGTSVIARGDHGPQWLCSVSPEAVPRASERIRAALIALSGRLSRYSLHTAGHRHFRVTVSGFTGGLNSFQSP